jgi:hypothetical protein
MKPSVYTQLSSSSQRPQDHLRKLSPSQAARISSPPDTTVFVTLTGLHYNPAYWGAAPAEFTQRKWDARDPDSGWYADDGTPIATEIQAGSQLRQPLKGS